jgi:hypothetical protein
MKKNTKRRILHYVSCSSSSRSAKLLESYRTRNRYIVQEGLSLLSLWRTVVLLGASIALGKGRVSTTGRGSRGGRSRRVVSTIGS